MRQIFYTKPGVSVVEVPEPRIMHEDDVKIRIAYVSVCGSDISMIKGLVDDHYSGDRISMGHEASGYITELGAGAKEKKLKVGDKVTFNFMKYCNKCKYCRSGKENMCSNPVSMENAMSDYVVVSEKQVFKLQDDANMVMAALIEPISVALHGIDRCEIKMGTTVAIFGGGGIGQFMVQLAKLSGATRVTLIEPVKQKRSIAMENGADHTIDPVHQNVHQEALKITDGFMYDTVIECSGAKEALMEAYDITGCGGILELIAMYKNAINLDFIDLNKNFFNKKEITIKTAYQSPYAFYRAIEIYKKLNLTPFIKDIYDVSQCNEAMRAQENHENVKSIISFGG